MAQLNSVEKLERRIEVTAEISDYVYNYERQYNILLKEAETKGKTPDLESINADSIGVIEDDLPSNTSIVDAVYDQNTGMAAIAVEDNKTGETYIAFAGTNDKADGYMDIRSDMAIGLNDSLYLRAMNQTGLDFYEKIERMGKDITTTTGHSLGTHPSAVVAATYQVPYHFGYQGAPNSVNGPTAQEWATKGDSQLLNRLSQIAKGLEAAGVTLPKDVKAYWDYLDKLKKSTPEDIAAAKAEAQRIRELFANYQGLSITYSTTRDALTNFVHQQAEEEIYLGGQVLDNDMAEYALDTLTPGVMAYADVSMDTAYLGSVFVIDRETYHNMTDFVNDPEAIRQAQDQAIAMLYSVDIDGNGTIDFEVTRENAITRSIYPSFATSESDKTISLERDALTHLANVGLSRLVSQLDTLIAATNQSHAANSQVMDTLPSRRESLKEAVISHLDSIQLIQAIKEIDQSCQDLDDATTCLSPIKLYETKDFTANFDLIGTSMLYDYFDQDGTLWSYTPTLNALETMIDNVLPLSASIEYALDYSYTSQQGDSGEGMSGIGAVTRAGKKGEYIIDSYEGMIEESTKGLGSRSHFVDGIPEALNEILPVVAQNLTTIRDCITYLQSVVLLLVETMTAADVSLADAITTFDTSSIAPVEVSVPQDYYTFLMQSGVFDDMSVLKAFDDQVDIKATELATEMSAELTAYIRDIDLTITTIKEQLGNAKEKIKTVAKKYLPVEVYYRSKIPDPLKSDTANKELHLWGTVESAVSISGDIKTASTDLEGIYKQLTTAITTINNTYTALGGFYQPFRLGMEEAFYGVAGLANVVRAQKGVTLVLNAIISSLTEFLAQLSLHQGSAVDAILGKTSETVTLAGYVSTLLTDCFGD